MVTQVFRRSGRCVVRTFSVVRVAARRTVQVIAHPGLTLRHTQRAPPSSPRIQNSRSLPVSPRTPKYSPNSPARRVYIRQASYFRENKHCPERLEDVLSAQEGGSRRKEMMHYSEEEAAYEPIIIHEEIGDLSPPFWVTALSALLTAICIFYSFLIMDAHLGSFRLGRFFEIVFVALLGICMATSILILFAPYSLGLHRGPLDVLLDMLGVPVPRDSVDFFAQSNQEEEFVQQELGNNNQQKDSSPENNQQRSEDDDDGIVCTQNLQPPISPKASGAQLASEEESMTARNAVLRCRALINEGDECDLDDPFLHVISMELNNLNPKAAYQAFWAGPQGGEFYANFLNTCAKNKNAQADEWQSKNDHEIRSMTTLHPLATNIRFPGLNLVIPTSKSQRAFHDLEEPTCLALFERSKFGGIPFGDALRVETVWIFENVQRITSKDIPVNKSHQEEIQENVLDTKGAQEDAILPPALDNIISTKVRIYFRCLFIDKVFPIPRWVKRTAIGKTKIELATTYGKWRDHVMGIVHSPSIAIEKRLLVNSDSMPIESTTFSDKEVLGTAPPALAESKSDDRPRSVRNDNTKHGRRHRSQQPKIDIFNSTQKNPIRTKQHSLDDLHISSSDRNYYNENNEQKIQPKRRRRASHRRKSRDKDDAVPPPPPQAPPIIIPDTAKAFDTIFCGGLRKSSPPNTCSGASSGIINTASFDDACLEMSPPLSAPASYDEYHHDDSKYSLRSRIRAPKILFGQSEKTPSKSNTINNSKSQPNALPKPRTSKLKTPPKRNLNSDKTPPKQLDLNNIKVSLPNSPAASEEEIAIFAASSIEVRHEEKEDIEDNPKDNQITPPTINPHGGSGSNFLLSSSIY